MDTALNVRTIQLSSRERLLLLLPLAGSAFGLFLTFGEQCLLPALIAAR